MQTSCVIHHLDIFVHSEVSFLVMDANYVCNFGLNFYLKLPLGQQYLLVGFRFLFYLDIFLELLELSSTLLVK